MATSFKLHGYPIERFLSAQVKVPLDSINEHNVLAGGSPPRRWEQPYLQSVG